MIKYLKHNEIDKGKWDNCIENATNPMVYGLSWYLDIICEHWDALILDDYQAVLPLPWKRKFGLKYIYHPFFAQQLGVFYQCDEKPNINSLLKAIPRTFVKYEISFNHTFEITGQDQFKRLNLILPLQSPYEETHKAFNSNTKRNIKKGLDTDWKFNSNVSVDQFLKLKKTNPVNDLNKHHFTILDQLFSKLIETKHGQIIGIENSDSQLLSAALFVTYKKRIIYLFSASANDGKTNSCMFKIVNKVIQENIKKINILDFEGSMVPGVARFFKGFGAQEEYYYRITKQNWPI